MNQTEKKTILVTGASRGIGKAIAETLSKEYEVVAISSDDFDLKDEAAIRAFTDKWEKPLYGIVNNAGICKTHNLEEEGIDPFEEVLAVNFKAPYLLTKLLTKHIEPRGRIVNISSQLGVEGRAGSGAYCASKFALIGLTKCWAKELGGKGITVNAVCPGWVGTEMSFKDVERLAKEKGVSYEEYYKQICAPLELKRFTTPEEIANLVEFLVSPKASGVTGRDWLLNTVWNQE